MFSSHLLFCFLDVSFRLFIEGLFDVIDFYDGFEDEWGGISWSLFGSRLSDTFFIKFLATTFLRAIYFSTTSWISIFLFSSFTNFYSSVFLLRIFSVWQDWYSIYLISWSFCKNVILVLVSNCSLLIYRALFFIYKAFPIISIILLYDTFLYQVQCLHFLPLFIGQIAFKILLVIDIFGMQCRILLH